MAVSDFFAQTKAAIADITDPSIPPTDVTLTNCDREPIHIPAAIQPHGVLLVIDAADHRIVQVSQNTAQYLGHPPEQLLGQPISVCLNEPQIQQIHHCLRDDFDAVNPLEFNLPVGDTVQSFTAVLHQVDNAIVLELEPATTQSPVNFFDFYSLVKQPLSRLQQTQTLAELLQVAVEEVRHVSGFDRVMVYQFDDDGAGSVVAEAKRSELSPFLGLHYPSTDIPKQAKYLYTLSLLRLIPDAAYQPVPLISSQSPAQPSPQPAPQLSAPLDMSLSTLRSVSPVHQEYLANMGVRASMSISLIRDRKLWGLIACHHGSPRWLPYETRTICEFLGQVVAVELAALEEREDSDYKLSLKAVQSQFVASLTNSATLKAGLTQDPQALLALTGSTGVAVCERGEITVLGKTPPLADIQGLVDWLATPFGTDVIYQTAQLSGVYPPAADFVDCASGLLALAISPIQQLYVLWFRPEVLQTVHWAGNPDKPVTTDDDHNLWISPRQSFELWQQTVQQRAMPWKPCEVETALELRSAVIGLVLQKADELAQINTELERSNVELDAFAYVASHDLKEPLRGIHNYSSFLIEDYGDQLGTEGNEKLQTLMRLTQRMEDLINSLLHYSRLGRAELSIETVDLGELVQGVIDVIKMSKPEQVSFQLPKPLPEVACDRTQITELFTNLISNAIKYNNSTDKWVEIGCQPAAIVTDQAHPPVNIPDNLVDNLPADGLIFYVRDNGIGIRPKHLKLIFRIFKRLHAPGRFGGGTGAGLTIAQKIVQRHGGQIWVDSIYGEGTTFYFTLAPHTEPQTTPDR